ncbi:MAG: ATP-binding protein [bacterium]
MTTGAMKASRPQSLGNDVSAAYTAAGVGTLQTHAVQFYDDDAFLIASVGDYLASGLALGQAVIAVTTEEHRTHLSAHLEGRGFDVERAVFRSQLIFADADALLATFMEQSLPNPERCRATIGEILRPHQQTIPRATVRVFGEMVDVLCRAGNFDGAIALEEIWNELAQHHTFSLLCGYSMHTFADARHTESIASICGTHAHVIPTERYMEVVGGSRLREIALLQQRAKALESEIEQRMQLETSLRSALTRAETANRAKNQFLAVMSHELRTPLNAIGGHVQLLEMELLGTVNERQRDALARVQRSQRHLLGLINDVLNLARLEASQVVYTCEPVLVDELLAEVCLLLEPLFATNDLRCTIESARDASALIVRADREKVHQILLNLFGNAIKFTPAGGRIVVRAGPCKGSASLIEIEVCDTGVGVPAEKLDAIFEPFVQIGGGTARNRDGVGLGLSISRTLARGMGGDLLAESDIERGSTFRLQLPAF